MLNLNIHSIHQDYTSNTQIQNIYYSIGNLKFNLPDMENLHQFFLNGSLNKQIEAGLSKDQAIAIQIKFILKTSFDHIFNPEKYISLTTIYQTYETQHPKYQSEIVNLFTDIEKHRKKMQDKIQPELNILEKKYQLGQLTISKFEELKNMLEKDPIYQEETKNFETAKKLYDLKCSEAILNYFEADKKTSITEATEAAIKQYQADYKLSQSSLE